jgi:DNA-binding NarL/FixJ family response regulator
LPKRVLVVDDHPAVALALKVAFRVDGRIELAGSAQTAAAGLELPRDGHDGVVLDLHLPGTGMGLAMCQRMVKRRGGSITARSKGPGQGSVFVLRLPAA